MTVERTARPRASDVDAQLRQATRARSDAPTAGATVERGGSMAGTIGHAAEVTHMALDTAVGVVETAGAAGSAGASFMVAAIAIPVLAEVAILAGFVHEMEEADADNRQLHTSRMEGLLAALEGRSDDIDVRRRAAQNPGYAEGLRAAERLAREHPEQFARAVDAVRRSGADGLAAVALGRDRTAAAQQRYAADPAYRHGVDFMRRLRQPVEQGGDPQRYEREVEAVRRRQADLDRGRRSAPVQP